MGPAVAFVGGSGAWQGFEPTRRATSAAKVPQMWRAPEGPEGTGGLRDRPLRAAGSRVAISRAAGPDGARNTSGATSTEKSELLVVLRVLVGLAAVGAAERADRRHLLGRQREGEDVEVLALALRVTGLG